MNEFIELENIVYKEKNYDKALSILNALECKDDKKYLELKANILFKKDNFLESAKIYEQIEEYSLVAYCYLLMNDINLAKEYFKKSEDSPAQNWGLFFCELFSNNITTGPTYLQIRAFLERDLSNFLRLNLVEFVQKIIDISDYLFNINPETNKFIAKAFLYNDYPEYAKEYLDRALDFTAQDAEIYYLFAKYNEQIGLPDKVKENLNEALKLNNNYVPAKIMIDNINMN